MPKRFTDTDKWKKEFIRGLGPEYKLLWLYILDDCDHAGVWHVDFEVARIRVGEDVDKQKAIGLFGDRIQIINGGSKWFIPDFIDFQYGELNPANRMHLSVINVLNKNDIKPLIRSLQGPKDKEQDKDKDKDKEQDKDKDGFELFWNKYGKKIGKPKTEKEWSKISSADKELIMKNLDAYCQREVKFRKDPERYLKHKTWEDQIVDNSNSNLPDRPL